MIAFSNLEEFKNSLKIGNKIKIIEANLLPSEKWIAEDLGIAIIEEINLENFSVILKNGERATFDLISKKSEIKGSFYFDKFPEMETTHQIYENTITFKNPEYPTYTFALISEQKSYCPECNGTGIGTVTIQTFGEEGKNISIINCRFCKGLLISKEAALKIKKEKEVEDSLWCSCTVDYGVTYKARGSAVCSKHHYICKKCKKIVQIG